MNKTMAIPGMRRSPASRQLPSLPLASLSLPSLLLASLLLAASAASAQSRPTRAGEKRVYCWEENGRKVCGDALPASAVDAPRTEISARSGLRVGEVARALTADEQKLADSAAEQAQREASAQAALRRRELAMVDSYATENDLRKAYGERIILVDEALKTSHMGVTNLRQSVLSLLRQASDLELQSKPVNKPLSDSIRNQHQDLLRQQAILEQQLAERASLGDDLEQALVRYRELKGGTVSNR
mgnify:CR=1 FL=1